MAERGFWAWWARRSKRTKNIIIGAIIIVPSVGWIPIRCYCVRGYGGTPKEAYVNGDRLVLVDEVCTGGGKSSPICDKRTTTVVIATGETDVDMSSGRVFSTRQPDCKGDPVVAIAGQMYLFKAGQVVQRDKDVAVEAIGGKAPARFTSPKFAGEVDGDFLVLDDEKGRVTVARVERTGVARWQATLAGTCQILAIHDGVLVVATDRPAARAAGIDLATGATRWQVSH